MPRKKATGNFTTRKRKDIIDEIVDMRINKGYTRLTITKYLEDTYGFKSSYCYELIRESTLKVDKIVGDNLTETIKENIQRFETLFEMAMKKGDVKGATKILKEISELSGHYIQRTQINHNVDHSITVIKLNGPEVINIAAEIECDAPTFSLPEAPEVLNTGSIEIVEPDPIEEKKYKEEN